MENSKNVFCRLCLEKISDNAFEILDSIKQEMLTTLLLDLNLLVDKGHVVCVACSNKLQRLFAFKTTCLNNNDYLKTFITDESRTNLNLEDIVVKKIKTEPIFEQQREKVCRFCLTHFENDCFTALAKMEDDIFLKDMLEKCFPEIDLKITNDPLMCSNCMEYLQSQFNFTVRCFDTEELIRNYLSSQINSNREINLCSIVEFMLNLRKENQYEDVGLDYTITLKRDKFESSIYDTAIKKEDEIQITNDTYKIGEGELMKAVNESYDCSNYLLPEPQMKPGIFDCPYCSHQTNRKDSLEKHLWRHKNANDVPKYKCNECNFETIWNLHQHKLLHKNAVEWYKCANCTYQSKYKKHLRRHMIVHLPSKMYRCNCCKYATNYFCNFRKHKKVKHNEEIEIEKYDEPKKNIKNSNRNSLNNKKVYRCDVCSYETTRIFHFKEHYLKHLAPDELILHKCHKCSFETKYSRSLRQHLLIHEKKAKRNQKSKTIMEVDRL